MTFGHRGRQMHFRLAAAALQQFSSVHLSALVPGWCHKCERTVRCWSPYVHLREQGEAVWAYLDKKGIQ